LLLVHGQNINRLFIFYTGLNFVHEPRCMRGAGRW